MINKQVDSLVRALSVVKSGDIILSGGFGEIGLPLNLVHALAEIDVRDLTLVSNNAGVGDVGLARLFKHGRVSRLLASFPSQAGADHFKNAYDRGEVQVELIPQGTLAERLRAGGSGLAGFFTPTGYGTELTEGKETRIIDGRGYVYESAIIGDVALVRAHRADRFGNLRYRLASRNFNPLMAMAARHTIAEVSQISTDRAIDPDDIHTPGVYIDRIVECA
jgi:3-oxoadipate CoA-transferase alpha subunit